MLIVKNKWLVNRFFLVKGTFLKGTFYICNLLASVVLIKLSVFKIN